MISLQQSLAMGMSVTRCHLQSQLEMFAIWLEENKAELKVKWGWGCGPFHWLVVKVQPSWEQLPEVGIRDQPLLPNFCTEGLIQQTLDLGDSSVGDTQYNCTLLGGEGRHQHRLSLSRMDIPNQTNKGQWQADQTLPWIFSSIVLL